MADYLNPEDIAAQSAIARQQKLADMLWQQGAQQPQGQVVSGQYVKPSPLQYLSNMANQYVGNKTSEAATKAQTDLAQKLRTQELQDLQTYGKIQRGTPASSVQPTIAGQPMRDDETGALYPPIVTKAIAGNPEAADLFAASSYAPALRAAGMKRLTEGPKWEKATIPQQDGSELHGWVNYNSPNPLTTFVQGGTKPAYTPIEGARFTYDTGMPVPTGAPQGQVRPVQAMPTQPVQNAPTQNVPVQTSNVPALIHPSNGSIMSSEDVKGYADRNTNGDIPAALDVLKRRQGFTEKQNAPMSNRQPVQASLMSNQVNPATGNAVPVSAMNRPAMSPKQAGEANQAVYTEQEKERQKSLKQLPTDINQAEQAIATVNQMIGDARLNDKGEIVYQKYDPTSKKWVAGAEPHGGFETYVGIGVPYWSNVHGTDTADFRTLYDSLKGQAFLEAFARIKGAGAITEVEGAKATQALLKLNNAQSEKEFIKYAREFQENAQKGMALAKEKAGVSQNYRSPVNQPALRWNPQTNSWVQ